MNKASETFATQAAVLLLQAKCPGCAVRVIWLVYQYLPCYRAVADTIIRLDIDVLWQDRERFHFLFLDLQLLCLVRCLSLK